MVDRNMRFPAQGQGFGMMQGAPQYVQTGMQFPTMQQQTMMSQGHPMMPHVQGQPMMSQGQGQPMMSQPMMTPAQRMMVPGMHPMMGMRMPPAGAPPPYTRQMQDSFNNRKKEISTGNRASGKTEEQIRKERQYQQQRDKLKHFGKPSAAGLDPNKLVDSIFGTSEKPKPKPKNIAIPQESEGDNGFGDFLSSPPASQSQQPTNQIPASVPGTNQIAATVSVPSQNQGTPPRKQTKVDPPKKDLTEMMFECSDLNAPEKAKLFHKPALKELPPTHHQSQVPVHSDSQAARKWNQTWNQSEELSELFIQEAQKDIQSMPQRPLPKHTSPTSKTAKHTSPISKHPPKPPPWLSDESLQPEIYKHVLEAALVDGMLSTERLYPILMLSGLPRELMGHIWSLCNKTTPGQLVKQELYQILALIALAQNNYQINSVDILSRCPHPPVPRLQQQGPALPVTQGSQPGISVAVQGSHIPEQGQQVPVHQGMPVPSQGGPQIQSTPATLPVTQLPSAGAPQSMLGLTTMTTEEEDDFADFQAAPPASQQPVTPPTVTGLKAPPGGPGLIAPPRASGPGRFGELMSDVKNDNRSPLKDHGAGYLSSVPTPDDAAVAATLSPEDLQTSNVENFFGSDDSSEGVGSHNSLDDDYFDGYKSADSKPSDSTSQFSTDQSENEDFKNFDNYLDEFQKKKEQKEKDSPYKKAMASPKKEIGSPSKVFPKVIPDILPVPGNKSQGTSLSQEVSSDFGDFADFQSAPVKSGTIQAPVANVKSSTSLNEIKPVASKTELIGDEDKYAALRVLDFSSPSNSGTDDLMGEPSVFASNEDSSVIANTEDTWADFQNAPTETVQTSASLVDQSQTEVSSKDVSGTVDDDAGWADFEMAAPSNDVSKGLQFNVLSVPAVPASIPVTMNITQTGSSNNSAEYGELSSAGNLEPVSDDWAEFQDSKNGDFTDFQESKDGDFADFQSSSGDFKAAVEEVKPAGLVSVKKGGLVKDDILGLFKVKDTPVTVVKSRDDDLNMYEPADTLSKDSVFKDAPETKDKNLTNKPLSPKRKAYSAPRLSSDGDDFMGPPPVDHFHEDNHDEGHFGSYSRGYDLDDMIMPQKKEEKEHKNIYGMYGLNASQVVSGHRNKDKDKSAFTEKAILEDDDSDQFELKPKFGLGKDMAEDSQSVASLDFVVSKRVQNLKESDADSADAQSVSSNEFGGNFETLSIKDILPESKSLDSLDLKRDDVNGDESSGSQGGSDKEKDSLDKEPVDMMVADLERVPTPESGLPVIGDRYSNILHDIPGSDKHAYEWQRCLDNCCRMIKDANNIFNSVSSSAVCNEIIRSTQGSEYIQGIIEIYRVVCRVMVSIKTAAVQTDRLTQLLKDIDLAWNNLTAFLVGGSVMPDAKSLDFSHGVIRDDDTTSQYLSCGVCLLSVDMKLKGISQDNGSTAAKLTYGGRQYHAACANLWINCVDSTLPALKLPELL